MKNQDQKPIKKTPLRERLLDGGHAIVAVSRAIRRCKAWKQTPLRTPLPEPRLETLALAVFASDSVTDAAAKAGYSPATAKQQGSRLLTQNVDLQQRIFGIYEDVFRGQKRHVLEKAEALTRATDRHRSRKLLMFPAWRMVGRTAEECATILEGLQEAGHE